MLSPDNPMVKFVLWGYALLSKIGDRAGLLLLLFFRVNWGWQFFVTGKGKLLNHPDVADFFTSLHLPFPDATAWFVGGVECIGGVLLLIGLATRPVGLILAVNMIVAYMSVADDRATVFNFFQKQDPFLHAGSVLFLAVSIAGIFASAALSGPLSVDAIIGKWLKKEAAQLQPASRQSGTKRKAESKLGRLIASYVTFTNIPNCRYTLALRWDASV